MNARTAEMSKMRGLKTSYSKPEKQQRELEAVLTKTQVGLEKLDYFLDAIEKLAVTSLYVFIEGNPVLHPTEEVQLEHVQGVIVAAQMVCPQLLEFKRDAKAFFLPKLQNVEVLVYTLDRYIQIIHRICENLDISHLSLRKPTHIVVNLDATLSDDDVQKMLCHISHLIDIRLDPDFRLVFLFQGVSCSGFIREFSKRQPKMLQFLKTLKKFIEDAQHLQDCLEEVTSQTVKIETSQVEVALGVSKIVSQIGFAGKSIDTVVDAASALKALKSEEVIVSAGNAFFLGMDVFFICKDSISLSKGSETEFSKFIRARAALWRSEIDAWGKNA
ncbi:uncharacterized protein LOC117831856 [Xyrichtys novacula]|uniref:Uncharacterized protein LOC117831856 n=1 Tax=Xyrichtys novacula TaxID=13765 RepID=A0AAV1GWH3_XYRNO|nr:uncharacterized protein LOC117831856 [Xyrichtys novacula]